jgi:hypothetical protein
MMRAFLFTTFLVIAAIGIGAFAIDIGGVGQSKTTTKPSEQFTVVQRPVPSSGLKLLTFEGTFPQVQHNGRPLAKVNATLRRTIISYEHNWISYWRPSPNPGFYAIVRGNQSAGAEVVSATDRAFSALLPVAASPGGTSFTLWIAVTVLVPSGVKVDLLKSLFRDPKQALRVIATNAKQQILSRNSPYGCDKAAFKSVGFPSGYDPNPVNYTNLALTDNGLAVGFPAGQIGIVACSNAEVTIPYGILRSYLSRLGTSLVNAIAK